MPANRVILPTAAGRTRMPGLSALERNHPAAPMHRSPVPADSTGYEKADVSAPDALRICLSSAFLFTFYTAQVLCILKREMHQSGTGNSEEGMSTV